MNSGILILSENSQMLSSAPEGSVLATSGDNWTGLKLEEQLLPPMEMKRHFAVGHRIVVNIGAPATYEFRRNGGWKQKIIQSRNISLIEAGSDNEVRWKQPLHLLVADLSSTFTEEFTGIGKLFFAEKRAIEDQMIYKLLSSLEKELQFGHSAGKLYGDSLALTLATHIAVNYSTSNRKLAAPKGKLSSYQLKKAIDYLNDLVMHNVGLRELSNELFLSPFHFARLFKNTLGLSPHQYLLRLKIMRAAQLMANTETSLTEVALSLGFYDQSHFIKVFKKIAGQVPREFLLQKK